MAEIATFNVNGIKARLPVLLDWLRSAAPDVVLLQEIKCQDAAFPVAEIEDLGYSVATHGQKTYNGVAILSRIGLEDVCRGLTVPWPADSVPPGSTPVPGTDTPAEDDSPSAVPPPQARYIEALVADARLRVASLYAPNGNPVSDPRKFGYKLAWMEGLADRARRHVREAPDLPMILGGDYNVCPTDDDVYDPDGWRDDALCRPESRRAFRRLVYEGYTDALRARTHAPGVYTYWDYQGGAWQKDHGLRIDHILLNPAAADRLLDARVDRSPRAAPRASDHTPLWVSLDL